MKYGRYQVVKEIGKGAVGKVYKARDPNLDLFVALKVLRREWVDSDTFVNRFLKEAKALGRLDRANIVRVFNVDEDKGDVYIAMEFVEGESLRDLMKKKEFTTEEIAQLGITIANALDYAHRQGIIHRDIKPSNILIRSDNFIKITDFGIAHIQDTDAQEKTQAGEVLGTPAYMSPEQVKGMTITSQTDIFSLGIILYELCTGTRPFKGENISAIFQAILKNKPAPVTKLNSSVPPALSQIIMKCLNKKPEDRFQSGKKLAAALEKYLKDRQSETIVLKKSAAESGSRKPVRYLLLILLLISLGIAFVYYSKTPESPPPPPVKKETLSHLNVVSFPPEAQVFVDNKYRGNAPLKIALPPGKHEVRVTAPDYHDWEAQINLKDTSETPLNVRLIPASEK
jgi:serine/threonine-protein kinase